MSDQPLRTIKSDIISELRQLQKGASSIPDKELIKFDFSTLPQKELKLLDRLSFFSSHRHIYKTLTNQYGSYKEKERYIEENLNILTTQEQVTFSRNKQFFKKHTWVYPCYITGGFTLGAFLTALWTLPSRVSTVKYTLIGLTLGVVSSYSFWRYHMVQYYGTLNGLFDIVTYQSYKMHKGRRVL